MTTASPGGIAGITLLAAWGLAFTLACRLVPSLPEDASTRDFASLLVGGGRQALSLSLFNEADRYFHKGVGHLESRVTPHRLFSHWQDAITPQGHAHADGLQSAEILPWLKLAARADPGNVDAFLVSAFWAESGLHRSDLALQILEEARRLNPSDYRVPLEMARLAIRSGRYPPARTSLECALQLQSARPGDTTPREASLDRAEILSFLGFISELNGQRAYAVDCFKNALAIFPDRSYIRERVATLEAGREPTDSAASLMEKLTRRSTQDACHDEHEDDVAAHSAPDAGEKEQP